MPPGSGPVVIEPSARPRVVVFRREPFVFSETFVVNQTAALERYAPVLVSTRGGRQAAPARVPAVAVGPRPLARAVELALLAGHAPHRLRRLLQGAGVVHAHFGPDAALLVAVMSKRTWRATPFVVTFHGYDATVTDEGLRRLGRIAGHFVDARGALFERADAIIAVSQFVADRLVRRGADARKVIVHYIGVDTAFFWSPDRPAPPRPSVLFLGRLHPKKGAGHLLRAAAALGRDGFAVPCTIAGAGPEDAALRRQARDDGLGVRFTGPVDATDARTLLHEARVLCVPSVTAPDGDAEGFGLVFAEAQACGVPVVSYRSGGVPEAVADGETGLLAPEGDVDGLAQRLRRLLTDDALWRRMSAAGRDRAVRAFDLRTQTAALEAIYDSRRSAPAPG